jgi:hypothetical protein
MADKLTDMSKIRKAIKLQSVLQLFYFFRINVLLL